MSTTHKVYGVAFAVYIVGSLIYSVASDPAAPTPAPSEQRAAASAAAPFTACDKLGGMVVAAARAEAQGYPESDMIAAAAMNHSLSSGNFANDREAIHWAYANKPTGADYIVFAKGRNACGLEYARSAR